MNVILHAFYEWNDEKRQITTIQFVKRTGLHNDA